MLPGNRQHCSGQMGDPNTVGPFPFSKNIRFHRNNPFAGTHHAALYDQPLTEGWCQKLDLHLDRHDIHVRFQQCERRKARR